MRRFLLRNRWATLSVVGLLLFATSGMAVSRMTCLMGGHSVLSFGASVDCCPSLEGNGGATIKAECCEFSLAKSDLSDVLPAFQLAWLAIAMPVEEVAWHAAVAGIVVRIERLDGRPPPGSAPERLALLSRYVI